MNLILAGLVAYIVFIPIFCATMAISIIKHKGCPVFSFWVSALGRSEFPNHKWFNVNIAIFGFLSFFLVIALKKLLPDVFLSKISLFFLCLTCGSTFLIGFFPSDINPNIHTFFGAAAYVGIIGSAIFTILPICGSPFIPNWIILINLLILFSLPLFVVYWFYDRKKAPDFLGKLAARKNGTWAWLVFLSAVSWDFLMAITTLLALT